MFQVYEMRTHDMSPTTIVVDLRKYSVTIRTEKSGWLEIYKDGKIFRSTSFTQLTLVSPYGSGGCGACGGMKKLWELECGLLERTKGLLDDRQDFRPADWKSTVDCPMCKKGLLLMNLEVPLAKEVMSLFAQTDCMDLYEGNPVTMLQVAKCSMQNQKQKIDELSKTVKKIRTLIAPFTENGRSPGK